MLSRKFLKFSPFLILTVLNLYSFSAHSREGGTSGGGGEAYAAHFATAGKNLGTAFEMVCATPNREQSVLCSYRARYASAVALAHVFPRAQLVGTNGKPRDAGPDGHGNVLLNVEAYAEKLKSETAVNGLIQLVAHEYFIAAGAEHDDSYDLSSTLVNTSRDHFMDLRQILGTIPRVSSFSWHTGDEIAHNLDGKFYCYEFDFEQKVQNAGNPVSERNCTTPQPSGISISKNFASTYRVSYEHVSGNVNCTPAGDEASSTAHGRCEAAGFKMNECVVTGLRLGHSGYDAASNEYECVMTATVTGTRR